MRPVNIIPDFIHTAEGSCLIEVGNTRVICTASIEETVPHFLRNGGKGWVTSEYAMIPRATLTRTARESAKGRIGGRTDVIQADGGTRTASITGAFIALGLALNKLVEAGTLSAAPVRDFVAATSVGIVDGEVMLDLAYEEDSRAEVDMNLVMTGGKKLVEIQGTAEQHPFDDAQLKKMMDFGRRGIESLIAKQQVVLSKLLLRQ